MKNNYLIRMVFTLLLCASFSMTYAADWYISTTGSDVVGVGDGSMSKPWASFSKAYAAAASGDIIYVSGMIDFTADPLNTANNGGTSTNNKAGVGILKNITIQGTSPSTDGFSGTNGANTTRFFRINSATATLTLKNLKLANGVAQSTAATPPGGGAITLTVGNIVAENVVFDGNTATGSTIISGAAVYITTTLGATFTNCVFSNNKAEKGGAVYINKWEAGTASVPSIIQFESCSFISNESKTTNGGSALLASTNNDYTTLNIINSTFSKNKVLSSTNAIGGTVFITNGKQTTNVNIINCTISENTTASGIGYGAGVYVLNSVHNGTSGINNFIGNVYIKNSIIENNTASGGTYSDVALFNFSPTVCCTGLFGATGAPGIPGYVQVENSIIGKSGNTPSKIPAGNVISSFYDLQVGSTLFAGLDAFNTTNNSYALLDDSPAIALASTSFLTSLVPSVTTDQLGKTRPATSCSAGSVEKNPVLGLKKNLKNSIVVYRNANNQITVENADMDYTGSITVYNTLGQVVAKQAVKNAVTTIEKTLNAGIYIVMLNNAKGSNTKKVIIN